MTNISVTEFSEFNENIKGKLKCFSADFLVTDSSDYSSFINDMNDNVIHVNILSIPVQL